MSCTMSRTRDLELQVLRLVVLWCLTFLFSEMATDMPSRPVPLHMLSQPPEAYCWHHSPRSGQGRRPPAALIPVLALHS